MSFASHSSSYNFNRRSSSVSWRNEDRKCSIQIQQPSGDTHVLWDPWFNLQLNDRSNNKTDSINRLENPRMSLLGKPINYRSNRRDVRYRKLQAKLYNFLERPTGKYATLYHVLVFAIVFLCLGLSVFSTIEGHEYEVYVEATLFYLEIVIVLWFGIEFLVRLWSSGCRSRYQGCIGRLRFMKSPFCIIDVITVCASVVVLSGPNGQLFAASALRGLRFFQILRMVRMDRRGGTWKLLGSVVYAHRQELITTIYIGFLGLVFSSFVIYIVEKDHNDDFKSFADALWWGVITLCTVGYGDAVPKSWKGKIIASCCALLGISFFALPAGILGSGFALKVQQQQRQKHMIRRRVPAATLIQCLWRCYAADENSSSEATWKIHQIPQRSPPPFKNNTSFVTRFNTLRRGRSSAHPYSPAASYSSNKLHPANSSNDNLSTNEEPSHELHRDSSDSRLGKKSSDDDDDVSLQPITLTRQHRGAIRAVRKIKYMLARRKFKEALKPYDVKDVLEQYSAGHVDLIGKVKFLQCRLDQILGRQGSKGKDVYDSKQSLASRIVKTERQVDDIEDKLERLIQMYEDDRKKFAQIPYASPHAPPCTPCPSSPSPPFQHMPTNNLQQQHVNRPKPILLDSTQSVNIDSPTSYSKFGFNSNHYNDVNSGNNGTNPHITSSFSSSNNLNRATISKPIMKKRVTLSSSSVVDGEEEDSINEINEQDVETANTTPPRDSDNNHKSSIPVEYMKPREYGRIEKVESFCSSNSSVMIPPSVRIEGCTPPSDSSIEMNEHDAYTFTETRDSIDSTANDYHPKQQPSSSEVNTSDSHHSEVGSGGVTSEIVVSPLDLVEFSHHPHYNHHQFHYRHRPVAASASLPGIAHHPFTNIPSVVIDNEDKSSNVRPSTSSRPVRRTASSPAKEYGGLSNMSNMKNLP
ncbi:potassium voltage-gated channel subfamily KQT member 1 isoform X28 [Lepeophtheirus salmonis]|uniref:potassium voltage-gated channel subfamily KQT member 1 isoform X28 n=1 Tax=Lepeophtheirus salmonis TaxID=72036 RepID=UPI001AE28CA7|nr:potassium voltage-gated channel subfamily KQT member 1-like isoform X6 [Lepeophtheirus salmonis]